MVGRGRCNPWVGALESILPHWSLDPWPQCPWKTWPLNSRQSKRRCQDLGLDLHCDLVCKGPLASQGMATMFPAFNLRPSCLPPSFPQHSGPQGKMKTEGTGGNSDPFLYISLRPHGPCILPSPSYSFLSTLNPLPGMCPWCPNPVHILPILQGVAQSCLHHLPSLPQSPQGPLFLLWALNSWHLHHSCVALIHIQHCDIVYCLMWLGSVFACSFSIHFPHTWNQLCPIEI